MAYKATHWAWELELRMPEKFVLVALADMADESFSCFPGQKRIADMVGGSVKTVQRAIVELEEMGLLTREQRRAADGYRTSDRYVLAVGSLPNKATDSQETDSRVTVSLETVGPTSGDSESDLRRLRVQAIEQPDESPVEAPDGDAFDIDIPNGTRTAVVLPRPFIVTAHMREWAGREAVSVNLDAVTAEFVAYWREGEGKGKRKKNWPLTWMNRMRAVHERNVERGWKPADELEERKVIRNGRVVA